MEKLTNKAARRYLRQVRQLLPCSRSMKDKITGPLQGSLKEFLKERPEADTETLQLRFGTPESIAASCLENTDTADVLLRLRVRRRVMAAIIAAVIVLLASWCGYLMHTERSLKNYLDGHEEGNVVLDHTTASNPLAPQSPSDQ